MTDCNNNRLFEAVKQMEDHTRQLRYTSTFSTGQSGLSFGAFQHDIGGNSNARNGLIDLMKNNGQVIFSAKLS